LSFRKWGDVGDLVKLVMAKMGVATFPKRKVNWRMNWLIAHGQSLSLQMGMGLI